VLGGNGTVDVRLGAKQLPRVRVSGYRLYTLARLPAPRTAVLDLRFTPGIEAYAFTFG
jgi:hypothetical protein